MQWSRVFGANWTSTTNEDNCHYCVFKAFFFVIIWSGDTMSVIHLCAMSSVCLVLVYLDHCQVLSAKCCSCPIVRFRQTFGFICKKKVLFHIYTIILLLFWFIRSWTPKKVGQKTFFWPKHKTVDPIETSMSKVKDYLLNILTIFQIFYNLSFYIQGIMPPIQLENTASLCLDETISIVNQHPFISAKIISSKWHHH